MTDGTQINPFSVAGGDTIDTEALPNGRKAERFKLVIGASNVDNGNVSSANPLPVKPAPGATSTLTQVSFTGSTQVVLASNTSRIRAWLYNHSDNSCYLAFAATATTGAFTKRLLAGEFFPIENYTGVISAISDGNTGSMQVSELTA